jgi:hypothetical protein
MGENSFASNSFTDWNFQKYFLQMNLHSVVHSSRKNHFSISKNKDRVRENLILIARYKNLFHFVILKFRLKSTRKRGVYTTPLSLMKLFQFYFFLLNYFLLTVAG